MSETTMTKALVFTILRHAEDFPWRMQDIGLMGLRLDESGSTASRLEPELERGGPAHPRPPLRLHLSDHRRRADQHSVCGERCG